MPQSRPAPLSWVLSALKIATSDLFFNKVRLSSILPLDAIREVEALNYALFWIAHACYLRRF
jgi:hypothetical protein